MTPHDLDKLIRKYLQGKCNDEERSFIDSWYSSLGNKSGQGQCEIMDEKKVVSVEMRILNNLQKLVAEDPIVNHPPTIMGRAFWQLSAIAASVLLLIAIGYFMIYNQPAQVPHAEVITSSPLLSFDNPGTDAKRVILPDGSFVELSANSKIRFINNPDSPSRELFLEGEAWFDIAHNNQRPFYVYAGDIVTKVLGTSFNVKAFDKNTQVTVTVKTGKVSVYSKNAEHKKVVLSPNQEAVYDKKTASVASHSVSETKVTQLRPQVDEMSFEETPVSEVLTALAKDYSIDIVFDNETLSGCVLTSTFLEEGFYDRMDIICTAIGATYNVVDTRIVISSNGCNITNPNE